jgi:4-hydroxy-4-methyl-2-oxoglutarate aldolase
MSAASTLRFDHARPGAETVAALSRFSAATVHEAIGRSGAFPSSLKPIARGMKVCGPALTVECAPGDNLTIHAAIDGARTGDVLVVDYKGFVEAGPFGDIMGAACVAKGVAGLVIDGCVRDSADLSAMRFPVFSRGLSIKGTTKERPGAVGVPIVCADVPVSPGDVILGDDDGLVVVPMDRLADAIDASARRVEHERAMLERIRAGASTLDLLGLRGKLTGST